MIKTYREKKVNFKRFNIVFKSNVFGVKNLERFCFKMERKKKFHQIMFILFLVYEDISIKLPRLSGKQLPVQRQLTWLRKYRLIFVITDSSDRYDLCAY